MSNAWRNEPLESLVSWVPSPGACGATGGEGEATGPARAPQGSRMAGWHPGPGLSTQALPATGQLKPGIQTPQSSQLGVHSPHLLLKLTPERKLARDPLCHWAGPSRASGCAQATTQHYVPHPELASWGSPEDHKPSKPRCPQNRCHVTAGAQERLEHYGLNYCRQLWAGVPREGTPLLAYF